MGPVRLELRPPPWPSVSRGACGPPFVLSGKGTRVCRWPSDTGRSRSSVTTCVTSTTEPAAWITTPPVSGDRVRLPNTSALVTQCRFLTTTDLLEAPVEIIYLTPSTVVPEYADSVSFVHFRDLTDLAIDHHATIWDVMRKFVFPALK